MLCRKMTTSKFMIILLYLNFQIRQQEFHPQLYDSKRSFHSESQTFTNIYIKTQNFKTSLFIYHFQILFLSFKHRIHFSSSLLLQTKTCCILSKNILFQNQINCLYLHCLARFFELFPKTFEASGKSSGQVQIDCEQ